MRRNLCGRRREPGWLAALPEIDQEIYRAYYENGADVGTIRAEQARRGRTLTAAEVSECLDRLDASIDHRLRTRLAYDLHARSIGAASGSFLLFLDQLRLEHLAATDALRPDAQLLERRMQELLEGVQRSLEALATEDRKVVELYFYQRLSAQQIAARLGLPGPRRAYTLIQRAVARLRSILGPSLDGSSADVNSTDGKGKRAGG
jgi:DNA-directed RNA polymerase specialized sigma subunit